MQLSVLTAPFVEKPLEEAIIYLKGLGVQCLEIGAGRRPGKVHIDPGELLADNGKLREFKAIIENHGLDICALACHGNPVHPNKETAENAHRLFEDTASIAPKLGVDTIITFSGCPGDGHGDKYPNWVTCPWPDDYAELLEYQWNGILIPYWKSAAAFAKNAGVQKIALEMHPGFCVYNPYTLLRLRGAVGEIIGANFDPSHLFWQGIDPVTAIKKLKGAIYHFHAKDTCMDESNTSADGVLDTRHYGNVLERSWTFRTVGYGHDLGVWKRILSTLQTIGYQGAVSIEHEDCLMSIEEGLKKAVSFLKDAMIFEQPAQMWWA